uniref:AAA family ATPase n=1 Tax=Methanocaldococcus bathoardescens TaxID=1301915 RepID=UPI000693EF52
MFRVLKLLKNIINNRVSSTDLETHLYDKNKKTAKINVEVLFDESDKEIISKFLRIFFKINSPEIIKLCNYLKLNVMDNITNYFSEGRYIWECSELYCREPYFILRLRNLEEDMEKIINYLKERELTEITTDLIDHSKVIQELGHEVEVIKLTNDLKNIITSSVNALLSTYRENKELYFSTLINGEEIITQLIGEKDTLIKEFLENFGKYVDYIMKLKMDENILRAFIVLLSLNELLINRMSIDIDKVLEYIKKNPWDMEIIKYLQEIVEFCEINYNNKKISLNDVLLKIYENGIICYEYNHLEELKLGIPNSKFAELFKCLFENKNKNKESNIKLMKILRASEKKGLYLGIPPENWVSNYLFYLKNNINPKLRERYIKIKKMFEYIFRDENLSFDSILINNRPDIAVYSKDFEIPISMVGLGVKKILEILTLIFGYEGKVILLETPSGHLHPKYQKRLVKIFKNQNIESQIFVITYSPYFINGMSINNTFRFYKRGEKSTRSIRIKDIIEKLEKMYGHKYIIDSHIKRMFLSDAVILMSTNILNLTITDLVELAEAPVDEYIIETIYLRNIKSYKDYLSLLEFMKIPYILIFSEWDIYSLYKKEVFKEHDGLKIRYKLLDEGKYPREIEAYLKFFENKHPFWLSKEEFESIVKDYIETIENHRKELKRKGYNILTTYEDVAKYCINPLKEKLDNIIREKLFIFTYPESLEMILVNKDKIKHPVEKTPYEKSEIKRFKEFFEYFIKYHQL